MNNELFPHGRWLLCPPIHFDVTYEINPWMDVEQAPHRMLATEQWIHLHHTLLRLGAFIEYIEPDVNNPDLVFTANAGLVRGNKVVLSKFRYKERQGEEARFRSWFENKGFEIVQVQSGSFEGEGDALFAGDVLFAGGEFRSELSVYPEVARLLGIQNYVPCKLVDSRFYHLDTCFCPLNPKQALIHPPAFTQESLDLMSKSIELHAVSAEDALKFVCNAVVLGTDVVLPAKCDSTYRLLESLGFKVYPVELGEFLKGGGSAKCLSLRLQ